MAERRAAGWYADEADASALRYWDGRGWTPHTVPGPAGATPADRSDAPPDHDPVEAVAAIAPDFAPDHEQEADSPDPVLAALVAAPAAGPGHEPFEPAAHERAAAPVFAGVFADEAAADDDRITRTVRFAPEHTTVPTPTDRPAASVSVYGMTPARPGEELTAGQVALLVLAALAAGTVTLAIASAFAMMLLG